MPTRPPSPCTEPGCPRLVQSGRCATHKRQHARAYEARRPDRTAVLEFYRSSAWRNLRDEVLAEHPACADCGALATQVDHVIALRDRPELGVERANLRPLCRRCHSRRTLAASRERGGVR